MRLIKARVQNYRSIIDTGEFEVENLKTILVGPNEAGKTAILQALQQLNPPAKAPKFNVLRDYPRSKYHKISRKEVDAENVEVVRGTFSLSDEDISNAPDRLKGKELKYIFYRKMNNGGVHWIEGVAHPNYLSVKKDLMRMVAHLDREIPEGQPKASSDSLAKITGDSADSKSLYELAPALITWLNTVYTKVDEKNADEESRWQRLKDECDYALQYAKFMEYLDANKPTFVLYSNYFRVKPLLHLANLAERIRTNVLQDDAYDYGNICLLNLLGFSAKELSDLGRAEEPASNTTELDKYREKLDRRAYQLNSASVELTQQIVKVWNPSKNEQEVSKLRISADGQYLKVVVEDSIGVEVELDQRSEGFQWLVSFFIVFFSEAKGKHANTVLLLDEPGVSLHALKQREFRRTISQLAEDNQTIYSTHSPFMVGPDELDIVRVVELADRATGTKVHTTLSSTDPAAILPLQEALGYDLAQSLFSSQRNLILEGLTDYWYIEAISGLLKDGNKVALHDKVAMVPANTASKVVYFATILVAQNLKVAALLDSDNAGDQAAKQEVLVHRLGAKKILRTTDFTNPTIARAEIEDLVRATLINVAKTELQWDIEAEATAASDRPIVDIFTKKYGNAFSKYKLSKAFLRWARDHSVDDLSADEIANCSNLITAINNALK
ncbi:AAA family ATPase [Pseudomonas juntendi]|uniref:AAA family ATPase n=2 Tax=Pseudomonas TaxID=286 RepID=UPI001FFD1743|nr:AAA family ATPase [Pseudomonas juntendi]MCK2109532.1 ATP-binding protein [Pseudomonas juntendi]MCK2115279.1 ATP-binding protein [Pseudomonas juntendi]